uniref:Uncharacterized protein n=1 Tax=viral metagenome TaxID=1070528 RepID=A0A6C0EDV5_9ZZZZ
MESVFSTGKLDIISFLLYGLVPSPFNILAQISIRILKYNGSIDRWYLFILAFFCLIPPLTYIPLLGLFVFNGISDGPGLNPIDFTIAIPIIVYVLVEYLLPGINSEDQNSKNNFNIFLQILLIFLSILFNNIYRRYLNCNADQISKNKCSSTDAISFSSIGKAGLDTIVEYGLGVGLILLHRLIASMFEGENMNIILKILFGFFLALPDTVLWSIGFIFGTYITNGINNSDICNFCSSPYKYTVYEIGPVILSIVFIIYNYFFVDTNSGGDGEEPFGEGDDEAPEGDDEEPEGYGEE